MKVLLKDNKVIDISDKEFPVHPSLKWMDYKGNVKIGDIYNNSEMHSVKEENLANDSLLEKKIDALWDKIVLNNEDKIQQILNNTK